MRSIKAMLKSWSLLLTILTGAFIVSFAIMILLFKLTNFTISFAAIAASIFMVFISEDKKTTSFKNIYGAYSIAAICGYAGIIFGSGSIFVTALTLLIAIIAMVLLKTVHAPAIGFVISFVLNPFTLGTIVVVMLCVFALIFIAKSIKHILKHPDEFNLKVKDEKIKFNFKKKQRTGYIMLKDGIIRRPE